MSDIFQEFEGTAPPVAGKPAQANPPAVPAAGKRGPKKGTRKARGPRKDLAADAAPHIEPVPKKPRKKRAPNGSGAPKGTRSPAKGDFTDILTAMVGLSADEAKMVAGAARTLQGVSKKSRAKIVASLGRIFP